jgi:uncharacterized membrane protein YhaH (DUF805 family)
MKWYLLAFKNGLNFTGRAHRQEFWYFTLFHFIIGYSAIELEKLLSLTFQNSQYGYISTLYYLISFIPALSVGVRRLHDVGKSWFFYFNFLLPFFVTFVLLLLLKVAPSSIYSDLFHFDYFTPFLFLALYVIITFLLLVWLFITLARPGNVGENAYGPDPKASLGS